MASSLEEKALYVKALYKQGLKFPAWSVERTKFHTESFWLFSNWFRPQSEPYQPFHKEWMEIACGQQFFGVLAPRDHSKSTTFGSNYPIWRLFMQPESTIMLVASAASVAELQMRRIKECIETDDLLKKYFGNLYPTNPIKWTNTEIIVERPAGIAHPSVVALGVGAAILSRRAKFVIADDIVRDDEVGDEQRERLAAWVNGVLLGVLEPDDQVGFIGTKKHEWDFYGQLEQNRKYFYRRYDAIQKENPDGSWETLWPSKWPDKALKDRLELLGSHEFNRNYRNIAMGDNESPFPLKWLEKCKQWDLDLHWEYPYQDIKKVISIDLSMNSQTKGSSGSYFVALVLGLLPDNRYIVLNMIRSKTFNFPQQVEEVSHLIEKFPPDAVIVETNAYQRAMYDTLVLKYPHINIESHVTGRNKNSPDEGIPILQPIIESARLLFPYANPTARAISDVIIEELNRLLVARYTDTVMALWFGVKWLAQYVKTTKYRTRAAIL